MRGRVTSVIMPRSDCSLMRLRLLNGLHVDQLRNEPALAILELPGDLSPRPQREITLRHNPSQPCPIIYKGFFRLFHYTVLNHSSLDRRTARPHLPRAVPHAKESPVGSPSCAGLFEHGRCGSAGEGEQLLELMVQYLIAKRARRSRDQSLRGRREESPGSIGQEAG